ncbi:MAG: putative Ig domain-containing protein, partial [bacterium]
VSAGNHTLRWDYAKDGSQSNGSDRGWIDYIRLPAHQLGVTVTTSDLPDWTVDHAYSQQIAAQGGSGSLTFSDLNGDLEGTGLSLSTSGLLFGTPTVPGAVNFIVHVEDEGTASANKPLSFTINPHVAITTNSLPDVDVNSAYNQQLQASGGTAPLVWSDQDDELAAFGLTLSSGGVVSGTANPAGTVTFTAELIDNVGDLTEKEFSFEINADYLCGDADGDQIVNITDAVYLISFIFSQGPAPEPLLAGETNCDGFVSITDAVYIIQYIFSSGPVPCAGC